MTQQDAATGAAVRAGSARWVTGRRARVLLCASGVSFMIMLDSNIVAVSLPAIARDLGAVFADIEWVVSAYVLTFAALLMPAGALADRFGRRRLLIAGLAVFTLASLLCGLAPTVLVLNAARALQGVGAAIQLSAALAVLGHEFRGPERARAFAFWGTVIGVAVAAGPPLGGLITSAFGWRWAFLVNVPIGGALVALTASAVGESQDPDARRLDIAGIILLGSGLFCLVWALIGANADGWSGESTAMKLAAAAALLALFAVAETVQRRPMVDFGLFRRRTFLGSSVAMLGFASAAQVMMTYLPLYLQNVFGLSPALAGLGMLPFALPLFFCPRIAAGLAMRVSGRTLLAAGLAVVAAGNLATAAMVAMHLPYAVIAAGMLLTGCGAGLLNGETAKVSMSVIPPERSGMASGIGGTLRFVGLVTGITGLGAVLAGETGRQFARASAASGLADIGKAAARSMVSRIVAGDIEGAAAQVAAPARLAIAEIARRSFASGFATVLLAAGAIAVAAALLAFVLIDARETAPARPQDGAAPAAPAD
ncbi:MFS transporter [Labrys monachus]|uniref:EmrB/QacA subfamily drug resistance transporter n=1 Tax=Labrys monachus TaxID=217067 RepID=A0ABU0FFD6_9HYPH|nr:MFS transporter [Labrys monachus]MDQ0393313.1 EmrB/QacA subfamily drug resistance transporter [Labrys monachus]